jgi:uncharacterized membrane protein YfcA
VGIELSLADYLLVSFGVALGALAQGAIGFGANLLAVPVMAAVAPAALPGTMILLPLPLQVAMIRHEHHGIEWRDVGWLTLGRLPGVLVGTWVVTAVALDQLSVLTGVAVLVGVVVSVVATSIPFNRTSKLTIGMVSGTMGTATSIGGPPLALLYQHHDGKVLRPTLAACFLLGTAQSLASLGLAGVMEWWHLRLAIALLPALFLGLALSRLLARRLDGPWLRPAVLTLAAAAACVAVARGIG